MIQYHLAPNWAGGVRETYEFKTTLFTSRAGREQRTAERLLPRRSVEFSGWVRGDRMRALQGLMHDRGASSIMIPDPARYGVRLSVGAAAGATSIVLERVPLWLDRAQTISIASEDDAEFVGALALIPVSTGAFTIAFDDAFDVFYGGGGPSHPGAFNEAFDEAFDVFVGASQIPDENVTLELAAPLTRSWAAGSVVRPVADGMLQQQFATTFPTNNVMRFNAALAVLPPSFLPTLINTPGPTFNGRPVLDVSPNWATAPTVQFASPFETVDYGRGVTNDFLPVDFYTRLTQFNYSGRSREDVGRVLRLFWQMRGRQGEFWCPTWIEDMVPLGPLAADSIGLLVGPDAQRYRTSLVNRAVMIQLHDGRRIYRNVVGMQALSAGGQGAYQGAFDSSYDVARAGGATRLIFDQPLGISAARSDIALISWLNRSRFAVDSMTVDWRTDDVGQLVAQIMSLEVLD